MTRDWQELTRMTRGANLVVERVRLKEEDIVLEGSYELPPLAQLSMEDQIFIAAFIRSHGSIKDMEQLFSISYPTVKNRLNRIAHQLEFVEINPPPSPSEILSRLEQGELSVEEAVERLKG